MVGLDVNLTDQAALSSIAPAVLWWQVVLAVVAGAVVGLLSGALTILIERFEKLEAEEMEEREEYLRDIEEKRLAAGPDAEDAPEAPPWEMESYGWTWRERILSPLLTAIAFGAFALHQGVGVNLYIHLVWIAILIHILTFDLKHHLVLDVITFPALILALGLSPLTPNLGFNQAVEGAVVCGVLFLFMFSLSRLLFHGGFGLGDVKLSVVIGAIAGFDFAQVQFGALYAITYGVFIGGAVVLLLLITRLRGLRDSVAYAPFLCLGTALVLYQYL